MGPRVGIRQVGASLGVEEVGRRDISQRLRHGHRLVAQGPRGVPVQIECTQPFVALA